MVRSLLVDPITTTLLDVSVEIDPTEVVCADIPHCKDHFQICSVELSIVLGSVAFFELEQFIINGKKNSILKKLRLQKYQYSFFMKIRMHHLPGISSDKSTVVIREIKLFLIMNRIEFYFLLTTKVAELWSITLAGIVVLEVVSKGADFSNALDPTEQCWIFRNFKHFQYVGFTLFIIKFHKFLFNPKFNS